MAPGILGFHGYLLLVVVCWVPRSSPAVPSGCDDLIDLYLVVDSSESIIQDDPYGQPLLHWTHIKQFLRGVVGNLPVGPRRCKTGLLQYADETQHEFHLDAYVTSGAVDEHLARMRHLGGNTNTQLALEHVDRYLRNGTRGAREEARKVVLLVTDGLSNVDQFLSIQRALTLRRSGVTMFVVSLDTDVDEAEVTSLASEPASRHVIIENFSSDPVRMIDAAVYGICNLPVPTQAPPNCDVAMDLAIVIDNSGSIKNESTQSLENRNYDHLKKFVKSLLDILLIGEQDTRVGVVRFSDQASTVFKLDTFYDKRQMQQAIDEMPFDGGLTNISGALKQTKQDLFNIRHGDRPDVRNVVIIIADGESNVDPLQTSRAARRLKEAMARLYVVAVLTTKFDESELRDIASYPDQDHYFNSPSIANLPAIRYSLLKHVCEQDTLLQDEVPNTLEPPDLTH